LELKKLSSQQYYKSIEPTSEASPKTASQQASQQASPKKQLPLTQKIATLKRVFNNDLLTFGKFFFASYLTSETPKFHKEIYNMLESPLLRIAIGAPRGFGKSTLLDLVYLSWVVVNQKAKFILIISDTYSQSALFLETLKAELSTNDKLKGFYGELKSDKWSEDEIVSNGIMIKCIGSGMKVRGLKFRESRPDLVLLDDIENDESVDSKERREKLERWFNGALIPSVSVDARIVIIGTILHYDSLLSKLLSLKFYKDFYKKTYRATLPNGESLWKEHMSVEKLEKIKQNYTENGMSYVYYQEYQNDPVSSENRKFRQESFKFYTEDKLLGKLLNTFIAIDRAYSLKKTADFTAFVVVSVDKDNMWYVRMAERFKGTEPQIIEKMFDLKEFFKPLVMGFEQKAFEYTIKPSLDAEMRRRNNFFRIVELKDKGINKNKRIEGLVPRFENASIFLKEDQTDLMDELVRFPSAPFDDLNDALAHILTIAVPPKTFQENQVYIPKISKYS
jgi:phage terminase large subunit-like protein